MRPNMSTIQIQPLPITLDRLPQLYTRRVHHRDLRRVEMHEAVVEERSLELGIEDRRHQTAH